MRALFIGIALILTVTYFGIVGYAFYEHFYLEGKRKIFYVYCDKGENASIKDINKNGKWYKGTKVTFFMEEMKHNEICFISVR